MRKRMLALAAVLAVAAIPVVRFARGLVGESAGYRYKLTVSLDTPDGPRTGAGVLEVTRGQSGPSWGATGGGADDIKGEAIYLDLGEGRRPLGILRHTTWWELTPRRDRDWGPSDVLRHSIEPDRKKVDAYWSQREHFVEEVRRFQALTGVFDVRPHDLPDLVTFGNVADPNTVMYVDPENLAATLGPGVKWRAATIQVTAEPMTTGLEHKLPWLKMMTSSSFLDGEPSSSAADKRLADKLQRTDFIHPFPLR